MRLESPTRDANGRMVTTAYFDAQEAIAALCSDEDWLGMGRQSLVEGTVGWSSEEDWHGGTVAECRDLIRNGWREEVGRVVAPPRLTKGDVERVAKRRHVTGGMVNVGRYAADRPDCMVRKHKIPHHRSMLRIGVDKSANGGTSTSSMLDVGRTVLTVVSSLKARGYPCELWACDAATAKDGTRDVLDVRVLIQTPGQHVDGAHLAYWLAHKSVLRRAFFALEESLPQAIRKKWGLFKGGSYGGAIDLGIRDFSEWAPSANLGTQAAEQWAAEVLGRRS